MASKSTEQSQGKKIAEALKILEEAIKDGTKSLQEEINAHYPSLKEEFFGGKERFKEKCESFKTHASEKFANAREISEEKIKEVATKVDTQVHTNPWPYIGAIALLSFILGLFVGRED